MIWAILLILIIFLAFTLGAWRLLQRSVNPGRRTMEETKAREIKQGTLGNYEELDKKDYIIKSYDGYELHATYIPNDSKKFVIITHGHTCNRWASVKFVMLFRKLGYNAVIYDDRYHGENEGRKHITLGLKESKDLLAVINDTKKRYGRDILIGLHGESMGSAISNMVLEYDPGVSFVVSDCGYADFMSMGKTVARTEYHMIPLIVDYANLISRIVDKTDLREIRPIDSIKKNNIPICFIHGSADTLIDKINAERMFKENPGYKEIHIFEGSEHACSYIDNPERYFEIVKDFVSKAEKRK